MAYREVLRMEIAKVLRRWQAGSSQRNIASGTGLSRDTVRKYLAAAKEAGVVQEGPAPTEDQLSRLAGISRSGPRQSEGPSEELLGPWADQVYRWLNVERLQLTRIQELLAARGCQVAYSSLHRFVARRNWRGRSRSTVRIVKGGVMLGHWGGVKLYHPVGSCPPKKSELTGQHKCPRQWLRGMPCLRAGQQTAGRKVLILPILRQARLKVGRQRSLCYA